MHFFLQEDFQYIHLFLNPVVHLYKLALLSYYRKNRGGVSSFFLLLILFLDLFKPSFRR